MSLPMLKNIGFSILFILLLVSCQDDFERLKRNDWNPEMAIPLIDSRFDVYRVFKKTNDSGSVETGDDRVISLVYSGEIFRISGQELFSIPDVEFDLTIAQGELPFIGTGMSLKQLDFGQGILQVHIEHNSTEDVLISLNMPRTSKNGVPFQKVFRVNYSGSSVTVFDTIFDLAQYKSDLTGSSGQGSNMMNINYSSTGVTSGQPAPMNTFKVDFNNLAFNYLGGYLGKIDLGDFSDSLGMIAFENFRTGGIKFEEPKIIITTENGFGIPCLMSFNEFSGTRSGVTTKLTGDLVDKGMIVEAAKDTLNNAVSIENINDENSNLTDFLFSPPNALKFDIDLKANPANDTTAYNFVSSKSELIGNIDIELPLVGRLNSVAFEHTFDFSAEDFEDTRNATFKIWTKNFFPLGIYIQLYFLNENEDALDSLVVNGGTIFREAQVDENGFSVIPSIEESYIVMGESRFTRMVESTSKMRFKAILSSKASRFRPIRIRDDNYFEIKLGVIARINEKL